MKLPFVRLLIAIGGSSCLLLLAACGGTGAEGAQAPEPPPPPSPPPSEFNVHGELFSIDTGMIANANINLWVQRGGSGYSYWLANGPLQSDGLGLFEAQVPESEIFLFAFKDGFVQPCAARSQVTQDVEIRIEMQPVSALNVINAPRPQLSFEPSVTGTIFESTPTGRQAIAGANLWAQKVMDDGLATTRSDLGGGFYLCNLPEGTYIDIRSDGFKPLLVGPIGGAESAVLEIELKRESE